MSILMRWIEDNSILVLEFEEPWTGSDYRELLPKLNQALSVADHIVDIIADFSDSQHTIPLQTLIDMRRRLTPNDSVIGMTVFVSRTFSTTRLIDLLRKSSSGFASNTHVTRTCPDAIEYLKVVQQQRALR